MSVNPNEWKELADSLMIKPLSYGFLIFIVSSILLILIALNVMDEKSVGETAMFFLWGGLAVSIALIIMGIHSLLWRGLLAVFNIFTARRRTSEKLLTLKENAARLSPRAKYMLQSFMQQNRGRFQTPEWSDEFAELCNADLVAAEPAEEDALGIYTSSSSFAGKNYRVNELYYKNETKMNAKR